MKTIEKIEAEIKARREELAQLEADWLRAKSEPRDIQLARELHDITCTGNHTDGCGWYYETSSGNGDDWNARTHGEYLARARKIIKFCEHNDIDSTDAIAIFQMVRGH